MPRLPIYLILKAHREHPLLPSLLKECRSLEDARNELRWLRERVYACHSFDKKPYGFRNTYQTRRQWQELKKMCVQRGRGKPLQYILGDQPFGDLEILCEKGVLIPRLETELYTYHAKDVIVEGLKAGEFNPKSLRIIDLCSGTGCISLLLHSLLVPHVEKVKVLGVDVSHKAVNLALKNKTYNLRRGLLNRQAVTEVDFIQSDIFDLPGASTSSPLIDLLRITNSGKAEATRCPSTWDVLIANPPYVSPSNLVDGTTSRSVRRFEPLLALVPPIRDNAPGETMGLGPIFREDLFYPRLLSLGNQLDVKLVIFECGDAAQARRIVNMARAIFRRDETLSIYIWAGHNTANDDGGARAVVVKRFKQH